MTGHLILGVPILYVVLQWAALHKMRNGWHVAAVLPAVCMTGALLLMIVGIVAGADLALLAIMIGLPLATAYLLILWPLHLVLSRQA